MEEIRENKKKKNLFVAIIVLLVVLILVLLFLLSPLKELLFPATVEPEMILSVAESVGPDPGTGLYRIVVEAQVAGNPEPQVTFSRNDGVADMAVNQTLILLAAEEIYLLRAVAVNPHGSADAELELYAGIAPGTSGGAGSSDDTADGAAPDSNGNEADPGPDSNGDTAPEDDEGEPGSDDVVEPTGPRIADLFLVIDSDRVDLLNIPGESFPMRYEEATHRFMVIVENTVGEEPDLEVEATHGVVDRVGRGMLTDDAPENLIPFVVNWISPANPAGNLEALNVSLTFSACYRSGACDTETISLALLPEAEDRPEMTGNYSPVTALTGQVNEGGPVFKSSESSGVPSFYVGDLANNKKVKGFISFDISELAGKNITSARLNMQSTAVGSPGSYSGSLAIRSINYGNSLDAVDYNLPANSIRTFRPGFSDLSFSNDQLRNYIQSVAIEGGTFAQFVIDYPEVTNNATADGRSILVQDVSLVVTYN